MKLKRFSMKQILFTENYFMGVNEEGRNSEIDDETVHNFSFRQ